MKKLRVILIIILQGTGLMPASANSPAASSSSETLAPTREPTTTILVFGDSISAEYGIQRNSGWVSLLSQRLKSLDGHYRVVNASVSGETTAGGLARLPGALANHQPDLLILELGGNDGLRGYPVVHLEANLIQMIQLAQAENIEVLLAGMQIPPNYGARYITAFENTYRRVAQRTSISLTPFLLSEIALQKNLMQADGIHPNAAAQSKIVDALWPYLTPLLDELSLSADSSTQLKSSDESSCNPS